MNRFVECVLFLVGLIFGSFLNVCISRIPNDESVVHPRSHCRECGRPIRWYDNIPVLSFLLLRRHCRDCGSPIPYRYPAVELLTAIAFCACYLWFGPTLVTLKFCIFSFLLIGLIFMDAETGLLVHEFTYSGIVLGLVFAWFVPGDSSGAWLLALIFHKQINNAHCLSLLDSFLGAAFGAGFFYLAWALYYLTRKRHGLGFGDIALMAMAGAFLGLKLVLLVIACAPLLTLLYAVILLVIEAVRPRSSAGEIQAAGGPSLVDGFKAEEADLTAETAEPTPFLQREIPFGVFLGACSLAAIFFGESAWGWYLGKLLPH
jgi:leader peptidase (prepilin peptidase)/N-methyltransferase